MLVVIYFTIFNVRDNRRISRRPQFGLNQIKKALTYLEPVFVDVPPVFYGIEASYPCTFFDKAKLKAQLEKNYVQVFEFISEHQKYYVELKPFQYEGSFWKAVTED